MTRPPLVRCLVGLTVLTGWLSMTACGQAPPGQGRSKVTIVSLLHHPLFDEVLAGVRSALEGRNYDVVELNANGEIDKLRLLAQEALGADVIVPLSTPVTLAVSGAAPPTQKIVFSFVASPIDVGMGAKPPNMTGVSDQMNYQGIVDLIGELLPTATRIGMIYNPSERNSQFGVEQITAAARVAGKSVIVVPVAGSSGVPDAARSLQGKIDVIAVGSDNTVVSAMPGLVRTAFELRLPIVAGDSSSVRQGAVAAISADYTRMGIETGRVVIRLLDNPSLQPGSIEVLPITGDTVVLNIAAAARLALSIPPAILSKAAQKFDTISD